MKTLEPKDLRIGTNVMVGNAVVTVNKTIIEGVLNGLYKVKGIPLSESILKEFGFEKVKPRRGIQAAFLKDGVRINLSNSGNFYYKERHLYLHELQTLYWCLTGTELTKKEK
jgi:hypothetical protein